MASKTTIVIKGDFGANSEVQEGKTVVKFVTTSAAAATLGTALAAFSTGNLSKIAFSSVNDLGAAIPNNGSNIDQRGIVYFNDPTTGSTHKLEIPCWDTTEHPAVPDSRGLRLAAADVTAIVNAVNTATGKTYAPLWGKLVIKT